MNEYLDDVLDELQEIPEDDRFDIIQYYEEYFLDSGKTVEEVVDEYGSPKQFALKLKINYYSEQDDDESEYSQSPKRKIRLIWMIVIGLCASPLLIPLALAFILAIFGILLGLIGVIIGIYVVCISILGAGLFSIISGVAVLQQSIASGLFFVGLGLLATGVAVFFAPLLLKGTKWLFQMMMNFVKWVGRRFITKRAIHTTNSGV